MKIQILAIGRQQEILQTVLRLLNKNEAWSGTGVLTDEKAIELFQRRHFDIVLLTNGIEEMSELKLRSLFLFQQPEIIFIQHYGGGSGLLSNEIESALQAKAQQNKPVIHIKDEL